MSADWPPELAAARRVVYERFAQTGAPPSPAQVAAALGLDEEDARRRLAELHDRHQLVLGPGGDAIRMAHPFSAAPMAFVLRAPGDDRLWWGGCAWDSFGIVAALGEELEITTRCPGCGRTLTYLAGPQAAPPQDLVVRLPRPAREWWDDVVATCSDIRMCCSAQHARDYVAAAGLPDGELVPAAVMWRLALGWYGDRLDPDYAPQDTAQRQAQLDAAGLTGEFWRLP
jgi:hypothetical protein